LLRNDLISVLKIDKDIDINIILEDKKAPIAKIGATSRLGTAEVGC